MLPTDTMLTNQKCAAAGRCLLLALFVGLAGCTPPGPRALLTGERLIKEGKFTEAIEPLTEATVLLPRNAQAWNHLGLANHNAGKANAARSAYLKALEVDVNLAPARFNYGCLLLEIGQPAAAANEFAAYTMTQPKAVDGWLKRGRAELLAQQFDAAEKSLRTALTLNAKQPEVWNTLGIVQLFRSRTDTRRASERYADAFQAFNHSVQEQPTYAPALFNAALVSHYYLPRKPVDHRPFALEKYKAFLALNPSVDNLEAIQQVVANLETELSPKPPAPKPLPVAPTNPPPAVVNAPKPEPTPAPPKPTPAPVEPVVAKKPEPEPPVKPVVVASVVKPEMPTVKPAPPAPTPVPEPVKPAPPVPTFVPEPTVPKPAPPRPVEDIAPGWSGPRYSYLEPTAPTAGSRADAQSHFDLGLAMQRIGKHSDASAAYQRAIRADGAFFEAYHNLGIVAAQMGDLLKSTAAYETALALEPDSASARFNFALALQRGGYLRDAAVQLEKLLAKSPDDAGAHFALANLQSQQFNQPAKARAHYLRVLALNPQHPQATAIRFWLRENP